MAEFTTGDVPYELKIDTEPPFLKFQKTFPGLFQNFILTDSIYDFFPFCQFTLNDDGGIFTEKFLFTEGLKWKISLSENNTGLKSIRHNFYWSEYQMNNPFNAEVIAGPGIHIFGSHLRKQDSVKSKSFNSNISQIVTQIANTYIPADPTRTLNIAPTVNTGLWYQANETDEIFLKRLASYSFFAASPFAPFVTFFNLKGDFYFTTPFQLFRQRPIITYTYGTSNEDTKSIQQNNIRTFDIQFLGSPTNMKNYKKTLYSVNQLGTYIPEPVLFNQTVFKVNQATDKFLVKRDDALEKTREIRNFGIIDSPLQQNTYKGWRNNQYFDSVFGPYRINITVRYNSSAVSGKLVNLKFKSPDKKKANIAREYSGLWLIIQSGHFITNTGEIYSRLSLGRPSLNVDPNHTFYSLFV